MRLWFIPATAALLGGAYLAVGASPAAGMGWPVTSSTSLPGGVLAAPFGASWTAGRPGFVYWRRSNQRSAFDGQAVDAAGAAQGSPFVLKPPPGAFAWTTSRGSDETGRALLVAYPRTTSSPVQIALLKLSGKLTPRQRLAVRGRFVDACSDMATDGTAIVSWLERTVAIRRPRPKLRCLTPSRMVLDRSRNRRGNDLGSEFLHA